MIFFCIISRFHCRETKALSLCSSKTLIGSRRISIKERGQYQYFLSSGEGDSFLNCYNFLAKYQGSLWWKLGAETAGAAFTNTCSNSSSIPGKKRRDETKREVITPFLPPFVCHSQNCKWAHVPALVGEASPLSNSTATQLAMALRAATSLWWVTWEF